MGALHHKARHIRDIRQLVINGWVPKAFGAKFLSVFCRVERTFEEVAELGQSLDFPEERVHEIVRLAYAGKKGEPFQEIGGLSVCVLSLAQVLGMSADEAEETEVNRLLKKPLSDFHAKLELKLASGICSDPEAKVA